jgi:hypothetical protein
MAFKLTGYVEHTTPTKNVNGVSSLFSSYDNDFQRTNPSGSPACDGAEVST